MADLIPFTSNLPIVPNNNLPIVPKDIVPPKPGIIDVEFKVIDEVTAPLRAATNGLRELDNVAKTMSVAQRFQSIGQEAMKAAAAVNSAAGSMRSAMIDMVKPAQDFEKSMSHLSAVAGADPAGLDAMRKKALELGRDGRASASQVSAAMAEMSGYGFDPSEIVAATDPLVNFGRAAGMGLSETAALAGATLRQFGLNASDTARVADVLTAASKNSSMSVSALGDALKAAGPAASAAGLSLEQTSAMIAFLGKSGVAASETGTVLIGMINRLTALPKAAREELETLQVQTNDPATGKLLPVTEIMKAIDKAMDAKNYDGAQRLETMTKIFGPQPGNSSQQNIAASDKLINGMSTSGFSSLESAVSNSAGQAVQMAGTKTDNLDGRLQQWAIALETLKITLSTTLLPVLTQAIQSVTDFVKRLTGFAEANPEIARIGMILAMVATAALTAVGPLMMLFGMLASGAATAMGVLAAMAGPIGLVAAAAVAAAVLIYQNWDSVAAFFQGLWSGIVDGVAPLQPAFDALSAAMAPILSAGGRLVEWVKSLFSPVEGLSTAAGALGESWGHTIGVMATTMASPWLTDAAGMIASSWGLLTGVFGQVGAAISWLWNIYQTFFSGFASGFASAFEPSRFAALGQLFGPLVEASEKVISAFNNLLPSIGESTVSVEQFGHIVGVVIAGALNTVADFIAMMITVSTGMAQAMAGLLSGDFGAYLEGVKTGLGGVLTFFNSLFERLFGINLGEAAVNMFNGLVDGISNGIEGAKQVMGDIAFGIVLGLQAGLDSKIKDVATFVATIYTTITSHFKKMFGINSPSTVFAEFGSWLMEGLAAGLLAKVQSVLATLSNVGRAMLGSIKSIFGFDAGPADTVLDVANTVAGAANTVPGAANDNAKGALAASGQIARMPAPAMAELAQGPGTATGGAGGGGFGGAAPVTVNLSVSIAGSTDEDIVRRLELWVRNDGSRLIADAVSRETERRERAQFASRGG
ncbi:TP901 family phage tail tape measure protein [Azospirillum fermentarium]|uniref:phage tail tape measure protein n=1 Tax=Azospirillum fermentarium TaxID=1233114 RepID=UPI002227BD23|nr:phage tail tape measure protein [Azospirillum fermentarium]MCW2248681.1 TP901 family phage tail tape measure protein [Azospirillum fermentarium]